MNENWEREGLKFLEKILGENLSFEELENSLEDITNKKLFFTFIKNILQFLGISTKIGENIGQNIHLDMPPKKFLESYLNMVNQFYQNNPDLVEHLGDIGKNFIESLQSIDFHKDLFSISTGNDFEDLIKKRFLEELDKAEQVSKTAVVKSFKLALEFIEHNQSPDKLFTLSNYNKLGIQPENLKTDTTMNLIVSFLEMMFTKKQELFNLTDDEILDYLNEFVSRLGRAIEPFLKAIIVSIYNLQKISKRRRFDNFNKGFGYYLSPRSPLKIQHSNQEDYIDYRNAINHISGYDISFNRKLEEVIIKFNLMRETRGRVYWNKTVEMGLKKFETLFRDFRKLQDSFFSFFEVYIKSVDKNYQLKHSSIKVFFN